MTLSTETAKREGFENPTTVVAKATVRREVAFLHNDLRVRRLILDNAEKPGVLMVDSRKISQEGLRVLAGGELERELVELTNAVRVNGIVEFSRLKCNDSKANKKTSYGVKSLQKRIGRSENRGWRSIYAAIAMDQKSVDEIIDTIFKNEPHLFIIHPRSIDIYDLAGRGIRIDHEERPFVTFLESGYQE